MNDRQIAAIRPTDKRQEIKIEGAKSLYLICHVSGTKTFQYRPRIAGKLTRKSLGRYPDVSLRWARAEAGRLRGELELARQTYTPKPAVKPKQADSRITVTEAWRLYMVHEGSQRASAAHRAAMFRNDVRPHVGSKHLDELSRDCLEDLLAKKAIDYPVASNKMFAVLARFLGWCTVEGFRETRLNSNPIVNVAKQGTDAATCSRYLSEQEICWFFKHISAAGAFENGLIALLYTGQRREAIFGAKRQELDGDILTIKIKDPKAGNKGRPKTADVWLHPDVMALVLANGESSDGLFAGRGDAANKALNRVVGKMREEAVQVGKAMEKITPNDLRRTMSNWMGDAVDDDDEVLIEEFIIERCLSHISSTVRQKNYSSNRYLKPKKRAWRLYGEYLSNLRAISS